MFQHVLWYFQRLLDHTNAFIPMLFGIKVKAMLCLKGSLCNVMVHFLIVEQQDREKVNKAAFQTCITPTGRQQLFSSLGVGTSDLRQILYRFYTLFKFQIKILSFVKYLVKLISFFFSVTKNIYLFTEIKNSI